MKKRHRNRVVQTGRKVEMNKKRKKKLKLNWASVSRTWRRVRGENNSIRLKWSEHRELFTETPPHCLQSSLLTVLRLSLHSFMRNTLSQPSIEPFLIPPSSPPPSLPLSRRWLSLTVPLCLSNPSRLFIYFSELCWARSLFGICRSPPRPRSADSRLQPWKIRRRVT